MNWISIESTASAASAIATGFMAWMTYKAIAESRRQYRSQFRPILVIAPFEGVDLMRREDFLVIHPSSQNGEDHSYAVNGILKNIGSGPALNIRMHVRFQDIEGYGDVAEFAPVGAGGNYGSRENPLRIPVHLRGQFNDVDFQISPGLKWKIILEYQDVFGRMFHTIHGKDSRQPWTMIGEGAAPKGESPESRARLAETLIPVPPGNAA